ncbi:MAG: FAD-dependent oxidoreductase [Syntrophales bacterium]|nr:FAD-dependent oxidoreductase [Syntrophales bacterium]MDD5642348.1 FAD-dependent oxidoreductase [Syntrophales bacterium]
MTTYIIIGDGVAGNTAADSIRKHDQRGKIIIFSKESSPFYYVPALPEFVAGEKDVPKLIIHGLDWYEKNRLELHLDTKITGIDLPQKEVVTEKGERYRYDKLLLATGGNAFVPPIKGADAEGVFTLRTLEDARKIKEFVQKSKEVVLIGGGLLGLEAGNGLRRAGGHITVVEFFPRLLPRQMDVPGAAMLQRQMEGMGFTFYLGAATKEIRRDAGGLHVELEAGESLKADMVLISAGVRPELTLAKSLGLDIDKAVKVDDRMRTSLADIYAAGDLIEHRGRFYGIWPAAREQGKVAGAAMAGQEVEYSGTVMSNTLKVVGIDLFSAGEIDVEGTLESLVRKDEVQNTYRKLVLQDDVLVGAILLGDIHGSAEIQQAMKQGVNLKTLKGELNREDFDFQRLAQISA